MSTSPAPTLEAIQANHEKLLPHIHKTPVLPWEGLTKESLVGTDIHPVFKFELFQKTGTFKLRGALTRIAHLTTDEKTKGVVAGTGGNHGIAVAYAARLENVHAKIVIPKTINPMRRRAIEILGAEIIETDNIADVLDEMNKIAEAENRVVMHPFEHPQITLGTASLGYEFLEQVPDLDSIIVPIGGGGLISGIACAAKQIKPDIKIYGVEPERAHSMYLSFQQGVPTALPEKPDSIADSLCLPRALPYSFAVCQQFIDGIVLVSDDDMKRSMKMLFETMKLGCEPACAVATAGLIGPLRETCQGQKVGVLLCGSNIDPDTFHSLISDIPAQENPSP